MSGTDFLRRGVVLAAGVALAVSVFMARPSSAIEPTDPDAVFPSESGVPPSDGGAGAATLESNRQAMARTVADTAAIAAYQQQLAQYRAQEAQYREQSAEAQRQSAAYKAMQERYLSELAARNGKPLPAPHSAKVDPGSDEVTCRDVLLTGSRAAHRECHTKQEWKALP